jgi:acetyltransferase EpsM
MRVVGPLSRVREWPHARVVDTLGSPASFRRRPERIGALVIDHDRFETIVHPDAYLSPRCEIGPGSLVYPQVTICANVKLGTHVIILAHSVINHDCSIGDYAIVASGVCLAGRVSIGRACYVGMASAVIQDTIVGDQALIGLGSVVIHDVLSGCVVAGNPARPLRPTNTSAAERPV